MFPTSFHGSAKGARRLQSAEERLRVRNEQSARLVIALEAWLREQCVRLSNSSSVAHTIDYMLRRWDRFARFVNNGRICLTNNAAERAQGKAAQRATRLETDGS